MKNYRTVITYASGYELWLIHIEKLKNQEKGHWKWETKRKKK